MSLDNELAETLRAVRGLRAIRQDDLEDYFHDAITKALSKGRSLEAWWGYVYKSVFHRVACGQEGRIHLPLEESLMAEERPINIETRIDVRAALQSLTPLQQEYIYAYFYEEYTLDEIAMLYEVSWQTVWETIKRGLGNMKVTLTDNKKEG